MLCATSHAQIPNVAGVALHRVTSPAYFLTLMEDWVAILCCSQTLVNLPLGERLGRKAPRTEGTYV